MGQEGRVVVEIQIMLLNPEMIRNLGLAVNEAKIYETLLKDGQCSAGHISKEAKINRRNVYDSLKRLLDKGLVFEIVQGKESQYQAVDPHKLDEILSEKQRALSRVMPQLISLYNNKSGKEQVYIYQGLEGFKNYMRDILRLGKDYYAIGAKSLWITKELSNFVDWFIAEARRKKIKFFMLYDHEVKGNHEKIVSYLGDNYKFLPPAYSTNTTIHIFGDHVVTFSKARVATFDEDVNLTVIINERVAEGYRTWFKYMWDNCPS